MEPSNSVGLFFYLFFICYIYQLQEPWKVPVYRNLHVLCFMLCGFGAQLQEERWGRAIQGAVPSEVTGTPVAHFAN